MKNFPETLKLSWVGKGEYVLRSHEFKPGIEPVFLGRCRKILFLLFLDYSTEVYSLYKGTSSRLIPVSTPSIVAGTGSSNPKEPSNVILRSGKVTGLIEELKIFFS